MGICFDFDEDLTSEKRRCLQLWPALRTYVWGTESKWVTNLASIKQLAADARFIHKYIDIAKYRPSSGQKQTRREYMDMYVSEISLNFRYHLARE